MAVRCVFYSPDAAGCCEVLRLAKAAPVVESTRKQLEARFCLSGGFIACPVFQRVERGLVAANRLRSGLADVEADPIISSDDTALAAG